MSKDWQKVPSSKDTVSTEAESQRKQRIKKKLFMSQGIVAHTFNHSTVDAERQADL